MPMLIDLSLALDSMELPLHSFLYLEDETSTSYPGLDLRALLLRPIGPIVLPDQIKIPGAAPAASGVDNLRASRLSLRLPAASSPANFHVGSSTGGGSPQEAQVADSGQIEVKIANVVSPDASVQETHLGHKVTALLPRSAAAFPSLISVGEESSGAAPFLLWSCHQAKKQKGCQAPQAGTSEQQEAYRGSFVATSDKARIDWIGNGHICLTAGRALAVNQGGKLAVDTPAACVTVDAGAAALVEVAAGVCVMALESQRTGQIVVAWKGADGKNRLAKLVAGEALILTDKLPESASGVRLTETSRLDNAIYAHFVLGDLLEKDVLLDWRDMALKPEQRSALADLWQRLTAAGDAVKKLPRR